MRGQAIQTFVPAHYIHTSMRNNDLALFSANFSKTVVKILKI